MSEKKNLAYFVRRVLEDHTDCENTLTKNKIAEYLLLEYGRRCDLRSISAALDWLIKIGLPIKYRSINYKGKEKKTDWQILSSQDSENSMLTILSFITSRYISEDEAKKIFCSFFDNTPELNIIKNENGIYDSKEILKSLFAINNAINDNNMLLFSIFDFVADNRKHFNELNGQVREYLVKPIKVIASYGILYLFCELGDTQIYRFFPIHRLTNLRSANIKFELYTDTSIPIPSSKLEAEWMFIGQREKAVLRIKTERLGEFTERFGGEYKVICSYAALTEVELFTDLRALKGLILSFGADIEVLSPTKLRRAVATELQAAVIKYSEIRKLRGNR